MFVPPRTHSITTLAALGANLLYGVLGSSLAARDFTTQMASPAPFGLPSILPASESLWFGSAEGFKGGFSYGLQVSSVYDSNFFLSEDDPECELTLNILPVIQYVSDPEGGAPFSFTTYYQPNIRSYLNNPDLGDIDHSGGASFQLTGGKTSISASVNYRTLSGTDRLTGSFTSGSIFEAGLRASYQIAPRTSLFGSWQYSSSDFETGGLTGSEATILEVGGLWAATERLSVGPSLRYTTSSSDNTGTREAWALSLLARYRVGERIHLEASLGLQYDQNSRDEGSNSMGMTGSLAAIYAINERLSWINSVEYVTVPSPNEENYQIDNLAITSALHRQFLRSSVGLGLEVIFSDYVDVGPVSSELANEKNYSAFLSYSRKLFSERVDLNSEIRYTLNRGNSDWSQVQVSLGLRVEF